MIFVILAIVFIETDTGIFQSCPNPLFVLSLYLYRLTTFVTAFMVMASRPADSASSMVTEQTASSPVSRFFMPRNMLELLRLTLAACRLKELPSVEHHRLLSHP